MYLWKAMEILRAVEGLRDPAERVELLAIAKTYMKLSYRADQRDTADRAFRDAL